MGDSSDERISPVSNNQGQKAFLQEASTGQGCLTGMQLPTKSEKLISTRFTVPLKSGCNDTEADRLLHTKMYPTPRGKLIRSPLQNLPYDQKCPLSYPMPTLVVGIDAKTTIDGRRLQLSSPTPGANGSHAPSQYENGPEDSYFTQLLRAEPSWSSSSSPLRGASASANNSPRRGRADSASSSVHRGARSGRNQSFYSQRRPPPIPRTYSMRASTLQQQGGSRGDLGPYGSEPMFVDMLQNRPGADELWHCRPLGANAPMEEYDVEYYDEIGGVAGSHADMAHRSRSSAAAVGRSIVFNDEWPLTGPMGSLTINAPNGPVSPNSPLGQPRQPSGSPSSLSSPHSNLRLKSAFSRGAPDGPSSPSPVSGIQRHYDGRHEARQVVQTSPDRSRVDKSAHIIRSARIVLADVRPPSASSSVTHQGMPVQGEALADAAESRSGNQPGIPGHEGEEEPSSLNSPGGRSQTLLGSGRVSHLAERRQQQEHPGSDRLLKQLSRSLSSPDRKNSVRTEGITARFMTGIIPNPENNSESNSHCASPVKNESPAPPKAPVTKASSELTPEPYLGSLSLEGGDPDLADCVDVM